MASQSEIFIASLPQVTIEDLPENEWTCSICTRGYRRRDFPDSILNDYSEIPLRLPCGHVFGKACLSNWLRRGSTCPVCRRQLFDRPLISAMYSPEPRDPQYRHSFETWYAGYVTARMDAQYGTRAGPGLIRGNPEFERWYAQHVTAWAASNHDRRLPTPVSDHDQRSARPTTTEQFHRMLDISNGYLDREAGTLRRRYALTAPLPDDDFIGGPRSTTMRQEGERAWASAARAGRAVARSPGNTSARTMQRMRPSHVYTPWVAPLNDGIRSSWGRERPDMEMRDYIVDSSDSDDSQTQETRRLRAILRSPEETRRPRDLGSSHTPRAVIRPNGISPLTPPPTENRIDNTVSPSERAIPAPPPPTPWSSVEPAVEYPGEVAIPTRTEDVAASMRQSIQVPRCNEPHGSSTRATPRTPATSRQRAMSSRTEAVVTRARARCESIPLSPGL